jgi:uncharacterized protein (TIGR00251 family)
MILDEYLDNLANNKEVYLKVKVLPGAGKTVFVDTMADETIKIAVAAQADKGKANLELIKFLAKEMGVYKYQVKIISGLTERIKLIKVSR